MIMAGGDIAQVEPVVEAPVEVSGWEFGGQGVLYYQTTDWASDVDLFDQDGARANAGVQLRAVNKDLFWGFGAGAEVNGVATLGLENDVVSNVMQRANGSLRGGWISQAYLTYGFGNTSIKGGRQELPKALSPFAFSEGWNVFKNTFDSVLVVNTDISDTTIVGAWVESANFNAPGSDMANFRKANGGSGVYMLTVQNKSISDLTLTGTYYYGAETSSGFTDDLNILWADAKYGFGSDYGIVLGLQGGTIMSDMFVDDTVAYGAKIGGNFGMFDASLAYSGVDDGDYGLWNVGGVKTPLYTQMILNQAAIRSDNDTFVVRAGLKALGGKFGLAYDYTTDNSVLENDYTELDLTYKTKVFNDSTTLFAGYVYQDVDGAWDDSRNLIRFWARYNF
jgi:hypothetical protein